MIQIEREQGSMNDYGWSDLIDVDRPNESLHLIRCIKGTILRLGSGFQNKEISYKHNRYLG